MRPPHIVEFIGIPGAGKTTIAFRTYERLALLYTTAFPKREEYRRRRLTKLEKASIDLKYARKLLGYRIRRIASECRWKGYRRWSFQLGWERSRYPSLLLDYMARYPAEVFILDEWLVHRTIEEAIRTDRKDVQFCRLFLTTSAIAPATERVSIFEAWREGRLT
jgi:adenylate kinase family enzyme